MESLRIGELQLTWLKGGNNHLDGGAMFGVVPKPLWSKRYPCNELNQIELRTDPILVQIRDLNLLIDSGMGKGKVNEKQMRNFGITEESQLDESLQQLGLKAEQIDYVLMTHLHFDHASGLTKWEGDQLVPTFPNAKHIASNVEWDEMRDPNIRSRNTYWRENWEAIQDLVHPFEGEMEVIPEIRMIHSGGHSAGHSIILYESKGEKGVHFGDLMPTAAHQNPLWVLAYDDYPMDSVFFKEKWVKKALAEERWFTFYHDAFRRAIRWSSEGEVIQQLLRERDELSF